MDFALSNCDKIKEQKLSDDTVSDVHIYMYEDLYIMLSHILDNLQIMNRNIKHKLRHKTRFLHISQTAQHQKENKIVRSIGSS